MSPIETRIAKAAVFYTAIIVTVTGACAGSLAQTDTYDWRSWGTVSDTLTVSRTGERLYLSSPFVASNSETVLAGGLVIPREQYEINYQRGILRINAPIGESTVVVSYVRLPFLLNSVYSLRDIEFADVRQDLPPSRTTIETRQPLINPGGNLVFGGMKSISFNVGTNRGTTLDQSLRATVEGNLTSSIKVRALLSDDNLPIQPEGNTEELEYLDKVFIEFAGPGAKAMLGDIAFQNSFSDFSTFRRELKGVSGEASLGDTKVGLSGGRSKGVFRTVNFRGTEQLQGPYDLLSQSRITGELIIAGTERVYFDGEELQRGQNRDYTISYDRGTITFTPRRLVTADTEIEVDFQVTQEQYDRTSAFATFQTSELPLGLTLRALVARETDDVSRPKRITLDDEELQIMAEAGDNPASAITEGAALVEPGSGDYDRVPPDSATGAPEHFEFNDVSGSYVLSFVEVPAGEGDYIIGGVSAAGKTIYEFVGVGMGQYVVGKTLPLPESHQVVTTRLAGESRHLDVDVQYNVSDFDANSMSSLGDGDNIGDAGEIRLRLKEIPGGFGKFDVIGSVSTLDENFRGLEKARPWYFYKDWNLERVPLRGREVIGNVTTAFKRGQNLLVDYTFGAIQRDNFEGIRQEAGFLAQTKGDRRLRARAFSTDVSGTDEKRLRRRGTASVAVGLMGVVPTARFTTEEYSVTSAARPDSGIAYDLYAIGLEKRTPERFDFKLEADQRNTEQLADSSGVWISSRRDRTIRASVASRSLSWLQGEMQYTHRIQDDWIVGGRSTADLARLKGVLRLDGFGLRTNFDYEISQNQARLQRKSVVFVGEGKGDYNALGEPVGKGRGAYTVVFLPTPQTTPTQAVDFTIHMSWQPAQARSGAGLGGLPSWISSNVSLEQSFSIREETQFEDAYKVYLFFPSALQRDDATLSGLVSLRQEWSLLNSLPSTSLTVRYQRDDEEENRFLPVREEKFFEQHLVRADRTLTKRVSANLQGKREVTRRSGKELPVGTGSTYDVMGWAVAGGVGLRFSAGSTLDAEVESQRREDAESTAIEEALSLRTRLLWRARKSLNVFGRYELTAFSDNGVTPRPFFFSSKGTTHRWGVTPNLKVSKIISVLTTYEGRSEETFTGKRVVEHEFRMETRAFF